MLGGAPGIGHDGQCHVLIRISVERRGVRHYQVLHLVRLRILVKRGLLRIVAHPHRAGFMNDLAAL